MAGWGFTIIIACLAQMLGVSAAFTEVWLGRGDQPQAGAFRAVMVQEPKSLDPHDAPDPAAWPVILACYYRLTTLKNGLTDPVPALARTIRVSDDGLKYTFVLHEGFTFSDGRPLNPEAVLFSFDRLMSREAGRKYFAPLKQLEIIGPNTFALVLDRPWPGFLNALAGPLASVVSPGLADRPDDYLRDHTLGAGRFALEDRQPGEITLAARVELTSRPRLGRAVFHFEPDPEKRLKLFESLQAHLLQSPPANAQPPENFESRNINSFVVCYLAFNQERAWDPELKQALITLVKNLNLGANLGARQVSGLFPDGLYQGWVPQGRPDFNEALGLEPPKGLFPEQSPQPLLLALEDSADFQILSDARLLAEALIKQGFPVLVEAQTAAELAKGRYDLFLGLKRPETGSPDEWLTSLVGPGNRAGYQNALAETLAWEIAAGSQRLTRVNKLNELAQLVYESEAYLPLYQVPLRVWVDRRVKGYAPHPMWPEAVTLDSVSLEIIRPAPKPSTPPLAIDPALPLPDDPDPLGLDRLN